VVEKPLEALAIEAAARERRRDDRENAGHVRMRFHGMHDASPAEAALIPEDFLKITISYTRTWALFVYIYARLPYTVIVRSDFSETMLFDATLSWLRERLPSTWEIGRTSRSDLRGANQDGPDLAIDLKGPSATYATILVQTASRPFGPRDVDRLLGTLGRTLRTMAGGTPVLIVSPWLSKRTRELLRAERLNYLDLTGNGLIRLDQPALYVETEGATKDPFRAPPGKTRIQGPKAGRLIRILADVAPPYSVSELAQTSRLTAGYVSRILEALDDEAIVERVARGRVQSVDVVRLLRRWAETYDVFRSNRASTYLAPRGATSLLPKLASSELRVAVTGSFAAVRDAPVAAPALLAAYVDSPAELAAALDLIPADQGANVALLAPFDPVVWLLTTTEDGIAYVARSQVAVDCLTGNGRMPAEGGALLEWMSQHEVAWRAPTLATVGKQDQR
jgi:hypothetical protein